MAALLSLGLGIGANTAIFTLTNAVFLHPLPVKNPSQVIELYTVDHATRTSAPNLTRTALSYPNFIDIREQSNVFSGLAGYTQAGVTLTGFAKPIQQAAFLVSANYFEVLGLHPIAGRFFRPDEDKIPGGNAVAVLSYTVAERLFGGASSAVGRTVNLSSISYDVIGVAPPNFKGTLTVGPPDEVWLPLSMHSQVLSGPAEEFFYNRRFRFVNAFGRLKPGVSEQQARAALQTIAARLETEYPNDNLGRTIDTSSLSEAALGFPRDQTLTAAIALSAAVGFVLLIACANIANLSLARATKRSKEMGIRVALGAARGRLMLQLLTEAELLAIAGGLLGIAIGWLGARALWALRPVGLAPGDLDIGLDFRVCLFTAGVSLLTGLLFGIAPVFRASIPDLTRILNSTGRGNVQGGSRNRLRSLLVMAEMALALIALAGAGLFIRSMRHAQRADFGYEMHNLCVFQFDLSSEHMTPERGRHFLRSAVESVSSVPGVASAAVSGGVPMFGGFFQTSFREGDAVQSRRGILALTSPVSPAYFTTLRIPLLEGRVLNDFDREKAKRVAVISEAMARQMWPNESAVGRRFRFVNSELMEVVGVVKNAVAFNVGEAPQPVVYLPEDQDYQPFTVMLVRTSVDPAHVLPSAMAAVQSLNHDLALLNPATIHDVISQALWAPHMGAGLFGLFGLLSMALAVIGVYGVMAYIVLQRTTEIGVRMAVGAASADIIRMVVGQSMRLALAGIAAGVCIALALTRLLSNLLYGVSPNDPATFCAVAGILGAVALLAGGLPAWRAARIDPVIALREE